MPNFVSPGVYVVEKDISEYSPTLNSSIVGIVGFATKGPTNKATLITSPQQLISTFGPPSEGLYGQGLEGALEILEATNQIYFVRAADEATTVAASATVPFGACPTVVVSATDGDGNYWGVDGSSVTLKVQSYDNNSVAQFASPQEYLIASGITTNSSVDGAAEAMRSVIGGDLPTANAFAEKLVDSGGTTLSATVCGSYAGGSAKIVVSAFDHNGDAVALLGEYDHTANAVNGALAATKTAYGASIPNTATSAGPAYYVEALYPGTGYNLSTNSAGDTIGNSIEIASFGDDEFVLSVNEDGSVRENFKTTLKDTAGAFIEDAINIGDTDLKSDRIKGYVVSSTSLTDLTFDGITTAYWGASASVGNVFGATMAISQNVGGSLTTSSASPVFIKPVEGSYSLSGGTDGMGESAEVLDAALIGSEANSPKTGIYTLDDEVIDISLALVPGVHSQNVQNYLISLAETTQNFLAVLAPPEGVGGVQAALDWTNGLKDTRTAAVNNSYGAVYWPHVKVYSVFDGKDRWYDPAIFAVRQMVYTDAVADPWFAPAGFVRGRLTKPSDVEVRLNQGDRDALYGNGNVVNPIVNFPKQGITVFGQRTTQRAPTALDRVNVRRLLIVLKKTLLAATRTFVFEPNDPITWEKIENLVNPLLDDIARRRGIVAFKVVCDETTNTPLRVDRNELWCKVLIKPTKAAEMIVFELNVTNQAAKLGG